MSAISKRAKKLYNHFEGWIVDDPPPERTGDAMNDFQNAFEYLRNGAKYGQDNLPPRYARNLRNCFRRIGKEESQNDTLQKDDL
jgi:hypothetical protein